jgi:hypothetical protein
MARTYLLLHRNAPQPRRHTAFPSIRPVGFLERHTDDSSIAVVHDGLACRASGQAHLDDTIL